MSRHTFRIRQSVVIFVVFAVLISLCACGNRRADDPYEGLVQVPDGAGGYMWTTLYDNLEASTFLPEEFCTDADTARVMYCGEDYEAAQGVDVSFYQRAIDWQAVADSGIDFAMIRAGYRGGSEGILYEDELFETNIRGALDAGLKVGVYFFSQAVTVEEAEEEARLVLELIDGYEIECPVAFDWEYIDTFQARTDEIGGSLLTDMCLAFCGVIESAGYEPAVYVYRYIGYSVYELDRLEGITVWAATHGDHPDFYYEHELWQYSVEGSVPGISTAVDMDMMFIPKSIEG